MRIRLISHGALSLVTILAAATACDRPSERTAGRGEAPQRSPSGAAERPPMNGEVMADARQRLVDDLRERGLRDERVLAAIGRVPRHELVPADLRVHAYEDRPLPIGHDQTISQPYVVALMSALADVGEGARVLEVGTGSGYQAAVLAELGARVYSIEIVEPLAARARHDLERLGYADRIELRVGDGYAGWPEAAPFDAVVVTAAPPRVPAPLKEQLKVGGRLVIPVGDLHQELRVIERTADGFVEHERIAVRFVPMTGRAQQPPE